MNRLDGPSAARAFGTELLTAVAGGAWIAARHLDGRPWRRRALRTAVTAVSTAGILLLDRDRPADPATRRPATPPGLPVAPDAVSLDADGAVGADAVERRRRRVAALPLLGAAVLFTGGALYGWRQVENRWMGRLGAKGHPRPAVGVGVRVGLLHLAVVGTLRTVRAATRTR